MKVIRAQRIAAAVVVLGVWGIVWSGTESLAASPDLTITALSAPGSAARGATISVVHTTRNGGDLLAGLSTNKFYLCTNTVAYGGNINQQSVPALLVGASKTLTNTTFIIPASATLGTNYIIAVCGFGIVEPNKSNNTNSTPILITP
jgi:hypothetical protein